MAPVGSGSGSGGSGSVGGGAGRGVWIGGALIVLAVLAIVVLSGRQRSEVPFDIGSSEPAGYRVLATLLRDRDATVSSTSAASLVDGDAAGGVAGDVVLVIPDPDLMTAREYAAAIAVAERGVVVVLGSPRTVDQDETDHGASDDPFESLGVSAAVPARLLAETPANPTGQGDCEIARLDGLGPIDTAFSTELGPPGRGSTSETRICYGDVSGSYVTEESRGSGSLVTLASPYLWANARLWPDKENGGEPLDNAALGLRLLGFTGDGATGGTSITFVDAIATPGAGRDGTRSPMELIPVGVKLGLGQLLAAFVIYAWWRSRRLGAVMVESMPVEIAGSELVVAVGDLLRRKGSPQRAADVLRAATRRELARRLGVPPDAPPDAVIAVVAGRIGGDPDAVRSALADGPVTTADELIRLASTLSDIRQEVLPSVVR